MTDTPEVAIPEWAKRHEDTAPILFEGWIRSGGSPEDLAWGAEGVYVAELEPEAPQEPEIQECPLCEETREEAAREIRDTAESLRQALDEAVAGFQEKLADVGRVVDRDIIGLAKLLAERVIRQAVELDPSLAETNLKRALQAAGALVDVTLKTHPDDLERIRGIAPSMAEELKGGPVKLNVLASDEVDRGGIIVVYEEGLIDARFEHQLDAIVHVVSDLVAQGQGREEIGHGQEGTD